MAETYQVTIGERMLTVSVRHHGEQTLVSVDGGPEEPAQLAGVQATLRTLRVRGRSQEVMASVDGDHVQLAIGGVSLAAEVVDQRRAGLAGVRRGGRSGHAQGELKAPMPGLVVKVLCAPGDEVKVGQPLVVLQAMKMENELSLPRGGTVQRVGAEAGQTVEQGQVLVVVA